MTCAKPDNWTQVAGVDLGIMQGSGIDWEG